jgi:putative ATPase
LSDLFQSVPGAEENNALPFSEEGTQERSSSGIQGQPYAGSKRAGSVPLAELMRPADLHDLVGQSHLLASDGLIHAMIKGDYQGSVIFWGPPGSGKTTMARLLARLMPHVIFEQISAIFSGVADLKKVFQKAEQNKARGKKTVLFVDEIHRFNRSQQDSFLPVLENGTVRLIGATTQNPSFELNNALLSRCEVLVFHQLDEKALDVVLAKACDYYAGQGRALQLEDEARQTLIALAQGDARALLTMLERLFSLDNENTITSDWLRRSFSRKAPLYDKDRDGHYDLISALHKSVRGSDVQAALYWLARMLQGGEDPRYLARRMIRMASEDIGLADPQALAQCLAASETYERLGSPEGELALAQAVIYLASAPKSNAAYVAYKKALQSAKETGHLAPPRHSVNAPTRLMKEQGYGEGYLYDHDMEHGFSGLNYFPESLARQNFYQPVERGFERDISKRLQFWEKRRTQS